MSDQQAEHRMFPMRIEEAENGGFVVTSRCGYGHDGSTFAFSNDIDLMDWLAHRVFGDPAHHSDPETVLVGIGALKQGDPPFRFARPDEAAIEAVHQLQRWANREVEHATGINEASLGQTIDPQDATAFRDRLEHMRIRRERREAEARRQDEAARNPLINP